MTLITIPCQTDDAQRSQGLATERAAMMRYAMPGGDVREKATMLVGVSVIGSLKLCACSSG